MYITFHNLIIEVNNFFRREPEWLFSTKDGRKKLLESAGHNRLAIITLHRGHHYENLEQVKQELNEHVKNLSPPGLTTQVHK